jgi:hypothetical protein
MRSYCHKHHRTYWFECPECRIEREQISQW